MNSEDKPMDSTAEIREGLIKAIEAEGTGYHFYLMAAEKTSDDKGRRTFEALAEEEMEHARYLRAQHESITKTGKINADEVLNAPKVEDASASPIFSENIKSRIKDAHYEMTALSIGIQLELSSINFYKAEAEKHGDPSIKSMYMELVEWEKGHYDLLLRQQENLREDYWSSGGFSPY